MQVHAARSFASTSAIPLPRHARRFHAGPCCLAQPAQNHYDTLRLPKDATRQQIKAQFYRLSKEYHPDVKPGNEAKFQQISEAYATLGHADSRRVYDASTSSSSSSYSSSHSSHGTPYAGYYYQDIDTSGTRRARANHAWENTRRTHPRYTYQRHNPFSHQHGQNGNVEDDHFDRMQAREAWKAANMSAGARRRMMYEAEKIQQEETLRNTSGIIRAVQAVGIIFGIMWLTGGWRASAWEHQEGEDGVESVS